MTTTLRTALAAAAAAHLRTHTAVVDIPYGAAKYSILYRSSEDLQAADGKIHRNYNGWVQILDRQIRSEISRL
jgi:hypothetical protein